MSHNNAHSEEIKSHGRSQLCHLKTKFNIHINGAEYWFYCVVIGNTAEWYGGGAYIHWKQSLMWMEVRATHCLMIIPLKLKVEIQLLYRTQIICFLNSALIPTLQSFSNHSPIWGTSVREWCDLSYTCALFWNHCGIQRLHGYGVYTSVLWFNKNFEQHHASTGAGIWICSGSLMYYQQPCRAHWRGHAYCFL